MKLTIFKGLFSKKSILNKNKWLFLSIVVLVCVGLYFYSRKNKENFETTLPEFKQILKDAGTQGMLDILGIELSDDYITEEEKKLSTRFNLSLINIITDIKDRIKYKCVIEGVDYTNSEMTSIMDYSRFKMNEKDTFKLSCGSDSSGETNLETTVNKLLENLDSSTKQLLVSEPKVSFVSGLRAESIYIMLAEGCIHSDMFKKDILPGLKNQISSYYPSIVVFDNTCEKHKEDKKTKIETPTVLNVCKLAGYYKSTPREVWDKPRVFPTIGYASIIEISKAVDKATRGDNIVSEKENEEYMKLEGKYANITFSEKRIGAEWAGQEDIYSNIMAIEWYDPVTNRYLLNNIEDTLDNGRLKRIRFVNLGDGSVDGRPWTSWTPPRPIDKINIEKTKNTNLAKTTSSLKIPIGTIIEVYDNGDTNNWNEYEVYWYNENTRLYLILNKISGKEKWEYVSMGNIEWRFKTEVVNNYYYTNHFDPKKKLDIENNIFIDEDNGTIEYSESKILDWLLTIR